MAKPYKEGIGWCVRCLYKGHDIFVSGKSSAEEAEQELWAVKESIRKKGIARHGGSKKKTLAHAMQLYGIEVLPALKGAAQLVRRINRYLRAQHLPTLVVTPAPAPSNHHFVVSTKPAGSERKIPNGLHIHRRDLLTKTADSDKFRDVLATKSFDDIVHADVQGFVHALSKDGVAAATVANEVALLSAVFKHSKKRWNWLPWRENPCHGLDKPTVDNVRKRVLKKEEQELLDAAFADAKNQSARHLYVLLRETAMRVSEPLMGARWCDVDWDDCILHLRDSKNGARDVPLSPKAIEALRALQDLAQSGPDDPLVHISYEAMKACLRRACDKAGIEDLNVHDLRRTGATRMGKKTGNLFLVQALTGHKTLAMVERYVQVTAADAVAVLHEPEPSVTVAAPAPVQSAQPAQGALLSLSAEQLQAMVAQAVTSAMGAAQAPTLPAAQPSNASAFVRAA